MWTMFDSTDASNIPSNAQWVAGYVDGLYKWSDADWARFPSATKVRIAVFPTTNDGNVLDVENGDATPAQAPSWVKMRRAAGIDPVVYCNRYTWPKVHQAFVDQGVEQPDYWIADWTGSMHVPAGAVACQYGAYGLYDVSEVLASWPGAVTVSQPDPMNIVHQAKDQLTKVQATLQAMSAEVATALKILNE